MKNNIQAELFPRNSYTSTSFGIELYTKLHDNFERKWKKLWDEWEINGKNIYAKIVFQGYEYAVWTPDNSSILLNYGCFMEWSESDIFDSKMTTKILTTLKKYILENQYQLEYEHTKAVQNQKSSKDSKK
jgi:hypothetical protein